MISLKQESNRCAVSVNKESVQVEHVEYGHFDVTQSMRFGDDISVTLDQHSPQAIWWAAMASEEGHRLRLFQEGLYLRYMAHCRYYAKLALKGLGDKETLEAVKDYVVILFSREKSTLSKSIMQAVFHGSLMTEHGTATAVKKVQESWTPDVRATMVAAFEKTMYSWENDHDVTYDDMLEVESEISKNVEVLKAASEQFKQRGVLLSASGGIKRAELQALGVNHVNGFQDRMAAEHSNPGRRA